MKETNRNLCECLDELWFTQHIYIVYITFFFYPLFLSRSISISAFSFEAKLAVISLECYYSFNVSFKLIDNIKINVTKKCPNNSIDYSAAFLCARSNPVLLSEHFNIISSIFWLWTTQYQPFQSFWLLNHFFTPR